jgi:hypothetical protein
MKTLNSFKNIQKMLLIVPIVAMNIGSIQGKDFNETMVDEVLPKTFILGTGWTALSGSAFVGKKIFNNLAQKHPLKKEHYLKMAQRSRNISRFSAIPLVSFTLGVMAGAVCWPLASKYPTDSFVGHTLEVVPHVVSFPCHAMTSIPAAYSSGLHNASHDLPLVHHDAGHAVQGDNNK